MALINVKQINPDGTLIIDAVQLNDPITLNNQAVTKQYVDSVAQGLGVKQAVRAATTVDLGADYDNGLGNDGVGATLTATANGAIVVDGVTLVVGDRVLVKNQSNQNENGIYDVTATGDLSNPFVLTRSDDANNSPLDGELRGGTFVFVTEGSTQDNQGYAISSPTGLASLGVDNIVWTQFNGAGNITAGDGLGQLGNTLFVNVDGNTIEINADTLRVKDAGITLNKLASLSVDENKLTSSVAGAGLAGGAGSALSVNVDNSTIEIATDTLQVKDGGITDAKLAAGIDAAKIADGSVSNTEFQYLNSVTSNVQDQLDAKVNSTDLASTSNGLGASLVGIEDVGNYFTGTTVEAALQEIGLQLDGAGNIDSRLDNIEAVIATTTGLAGVNFTSNNVVTDGTSLQAAISALDAFFGSNVTTSDFDKLADITSTASEIDAAVGATHQRVYDNLTVVTNGQTAFTLSSTPKSNSIVELFINGAGQVNGTDFTVSGTSLTWVSGDFNLSTTDKVTVVYDAVI